MVLRLSFKNKSIIPLNDFIERSNQPDRLVNDISSDSADLHGPLTIKFSLLSWYQCYFNTPTTSYPSYHMA